MLKTNIIICNQNLIFAHCKLQNTNQTNPNARKKYIFFIYLSSSWRIKCNRFVPTFTFTQYQLSRCYSLRMFYNMIVCVLDDRMRLVPGLDVVRVRENKLQSHSRRLRHI